MGDGKPPVTWKSTDSVRALGGIWVVAEGAGEMPGGGGNALPDDAGRVLTLDSEGPSMADTGEQAKYQDVIEIDDADHRRMISRMLGSDGLWREVMTARHTRVK